MLARITSPYFVAGVVFVDDCVTEAAPIVNYMKGWHGSAVRDYCSRKSWVLDTVDPCDIIVPSSGKPPV
jgi:hypothetical protein